jgi:hypothetical protein
MAAPANEKKKKYSPKLLEKAVNASNGQIKFLIAYSIQTEG